jgi:hypothetical protein
VFAIFQNMSQLRVFEGNLYLSHVVAQTETRSHFLPMTDFIYELVVPTEMQFFYEKHL